MIVTPLLPIPRKVKQMKIPAGYQNPYRLVLLRSKPSERSLTVDDVVVLRGTYLECEVRNPHPRLWDSWKYFSRDAEMIKADYLLYTLAVLGADERPGEVVLRVALGSGYDRELSPELSRLCLDIVERNQRGKRKPERPEAEASQCGPVDAGNASTTEKQDGASDQTREHCCGERSARRWPVRVKATIEIEALIGGDGPPRGYE